MTRRTPSYGPGSLGLVLAAVHRDRVTVRSEGGQQGREEGLVTAVGRWDRTTRRRRRCSGNRCDCSRLESPSSRLGHERDEITGGRCWPDSPGPTAPIGRAPVRPTCRRTAASGDVLAAGRRPSGREGPGRRAGTRSPATKPASSRGRPEVAGLPVDHHLADPADRRGDDRQTDRSRLEDGPRRHVVGGGQHEEVHRGEQFGDQLGRGARARDGSRCEVRVAAPWTCTGATRSRRRPPLLMPVQEAIAAFPVPVRSHEDHPRTCDAPGRRPGRHR